MRGMGRRATPWLLAAMVCAGPDPVVGQEAYPPVVLPRTEQRVLRSVHVGVPYRLYVSLPRGYEDSAKDYPVVFLLDADYSFAIARNLVEHLSDRGDLPEVILVGIAYDGPPAYRLNRTRDYTPTHVPSGGYGPTYQASSGGAPAFRDFITTELIPYITSELRVSDQRFVVGHSYGGLFATWVALTSPELFTGYLIVSPSLWYNGGLLFQLEEEAAEARSDWSVRVYMTVGDREINQQRNMVTDLSRMATALERRRYPSLQFHWEIAENETHNSVFPRALSNGLRFLLDGARR